MKSLCHITKLLSCLKTSETTKKQIYQNKEFLPAFSHSWWYRRHFEWDFRYHSPNSKWKSHSKHYRWTIWKKEEKKNERDTRRFYSEKNAKTKVREKGQTNVIVKSFPGVKLDCMSHYAIRTVKSNPDRIIIHCGTNNLKIDESQWQLLKRLLSWQKALNQPQMR